MVSINEVRQIVSDMIRVKYKDAIIENDTKIVSTGLIRSMEIFEVFLILEKQGVDINGISVEFMDSVSDIYRAIS